jgi:hypothetical protein
MLLVGCVCGGFGEFFIITGIATVIGWGWGWFVNRKPCCDHICEDDKGTQEHPHW